MSVPRAKLPMEPEGTTCRVALVTVEPDTIDGSSTRKKHNASRNGAPRTSVAPQARHQALPAAPRDDHQDASLRVFGRYA